MDKISIIIPVYNVEPYIRRCLDSVIGQTYENIEVLLINDGSTDGSGKICDEYAAKDGRIRVFHKENGGVGSARNVGLRNFTGEYVGFVDSDDWIEPDMYEALYKSIKRNNTQVSVCNFFTATNTSSVPRKNIVPIPDGILQPEDMLKYIFRLDLYNSFHIVVWNRLYSADIFRKHGITLNEELKFNDDVLFVPSIFLTKNCTGTYVDTPLYHYYRRPMSLVNSDSVKEKIHLLTAFTMVIDLFEEKGYRQFVPYVKKEYCYQASLIAEKCVEVGDAVTLKEIQLEMKRYFDVYCEVTEDKPERIERVKELIYYEMKPKE